MRSDGKGIEDRMCSGLDAVAGPPRNDFPHLAVDLVEILVHRKFPAAPRAAKSNRASPQPKFHLFTADPALHITLPRPA